MAKTKKDLKIDLAGLDDVDFTKEPDVKAAQSIIKPTPEKEAKPAKVPSKRSAKKTEVKKQIKGVLPPVGKKRLSFNIDADIHRALKELSFYEDVDMVEYVFEQLVKPDLKKRGYYPPKKSK